MMLSVKKWIIYRELPRKTSSEQVKQVKKMGKNWGQANKGNLMADVYYKPPDLGEDVNEVFLLQLQEYSHSRL